MKLRAILACFVLAGCASSGGGHVVGNSIGSEDTTKPKAVCGCTGEDVCKCENPKKPKKTCGCKE